jgi:hypothetical protein
VNKKAGSFVFLPKNSFQPIFGPKHLGNTLETMLNQSIAMKNAKNCLKTQNPPETKKKLLELRSDFLGVFNVKNNYSYLPFHMEPFDTFLVVGLFSNIHFLSLNRNPTTSLSSN